MNYIKKKKEIKELGYYDDFYRILKEVDDNDDDYEDKDFETYELELENEWND